MAAKIQHFEVELRQVGGVHLGDVLLFEPGLGDARGQRLQRGIVALDQGIGRQAAQLAGLGLADGDDGAGVVDDDAGGRDCRLQGEGRGLHGSGFRDRGNRPGARPGLN
ncbi:hypothetical protein ACVOMT_03460 [Sphingomonas panni]